MDIIKRYNDVVTNFCGEAKIIKEFSNFPLNMLADASQSPDEDIRFDMKIGINEKSGIIQVVELLPNEKLYIDTHSNAIGGMWRKHHEAVSQIIHQYNPGKVLEIGGGTGILESIYNKESLEPIEWMIVEPQPHPVKDTRATFIRGFFPEAVPEDIEYDVLVHTHTIEHMYSPYDFMKTLATNMPDGKRMVFSVPNLKNNLQSRMTSVINFEHTIYLTEDYVEYLLDHFGFIIEEKQYISNHSIIYSVIRNRKRICYSSINFRRLYDENLQTFNEWNDHHVQMIRRLNEQIDNYEGTLYLFGGHITTQFYIAFGLNKERITSILDNDPYKHGKRVGGTDLLISSPDIICDKDEVVVIIPQSPYADEIKKGLTEKHNKIIFWE